MFRARLRSTSRVGPPTKSAARTVADRSAVARVVTDVVRDDVAGTAPTSCTANVSSGQYLAGSLFDAGGEYGIESGRILTLTAAAPTVNHQFVSRVCG